jgi:hypothetical protein
MAPYLQVSAPAQLYPPPLHAICPAHPILLDFTTSTILGKEYRSFSSSLCNFLHSPVISSLLGPNNPNTQFSNTRQPTFLPQCLTHTNHYNNRSSCRLKQTLHMFKKAPLILSTVKTETCRRIIQLTEVLV